MLDMPFALMLSILDFSLHYHIDWARMYINKRYNYTPSDKGFWFWLGLDQLLHQLTYIVITIVTILIIGDFI